MTDIAIRVDNLSKLYHLGAVQQRPDTTSPSLSAGRRDALTGWMPRISQITRIGKKDNPSNPSNQWQASASDDLRALKDVSFEVKRGEVVGTPALASGASVPSTQLRTGIGRNGAGKSTLVSTRLNTRLKILSRSRAHQRPGRALRRPGRLLTDGGRCGVSAEALVVIQ